MIGNSYKITSEAHRRQVALTGRILIAWSLWRRTHQAAAQAAHINDKMQL